MANLYFLLAAPYWDPRTNTNPEKQETSLVKNLPNAKKPGMSAHI